MPLVICEEFLKYMDSFKPFLLAGLKNRAEYQVCHAAVGLVGDLARSLQAHISPHVKEIMEVLFEDLTVSVVFAIEQYHPDCTGCLSAPISKNCYNINIRRCCHSNWF